MSGSAQGTDQDHLSDMATVPVRRRCHGVFQSEASLLMSTLPSFWARKPARVPTPTQAHQSTAELSHPQPDRCSVHSATKSSSILSYHSLGTRSSTFSIKPTLHPGNIPSNNTPHTLLLRPCHSFRIRLADPNPLSKSMITPIPSSHSYE